MNHVTVSSSPIKVVLRYGNKGERGIILNSIYGASPTVQPTAIVMKCIIKT